MVLKKYGILVTLSMSLLTTTALFAPSAHDEDTGKITLTTPLKKSTDQGSSLSAEDEELTPEECNRRYLYTDTKEIPEPTVLDIAFAKGSETLTFILEVLSDPKEVGHSIVDAVIKKSPKVIELVHDASHSVADTVIKQSPKVVQTLEDAGATIATSSRSAVSAVLQLPPVVHLLTAYDMYTLEESTGNGLNLVLPKEEDGFTIVIDMNKTDASPTSSPTKKSEEESSETSWEIISSS